MYYIVGLCVLLCVLFFGCLQMYPLVVDWDSVLRAFVRESEREPLYSNVLIIVCDFVC